MAESVIVGCKLPNGLLLQVGEQTIRINGNARYNMPHPKRPVLNTDIAEGDGLTMVDKGFWDKWYADHKDYGPVKSGHVYASVGRENAVAKAKDTKENTTGLEPLDPLSVRGIEGTEDMAKVLKNAKKGM
jgi:hypothetical protein